MTTLVLLILQRIQFNIQGLSILKFAIISLETMSIMVIQFVSTENQLADLFTKPLNKERFNFLRNELGIIDFKFVK